MTVQIYQRLERAGSADETITLSFDHRQKCRLHATLDNGEEAAMILPRGEALRHGDRLLCHDNRVVRVCAAKEPVSTARSMDLYQLARACYHLGNRHVSLQICGGWLRYQQDPVLDTMLEGLGLQIRHELAAFEPESGAYHHSNEEERQAVVSALFERRAGHGG